MLANFDADYLGTYNLLYIKIPHSLIAHNSLNLVATYNFESEIL